MTDASDLAAIERQLDELHEACPPVEGGCWCCCMICTETDVPELIALQEEYWQLVQASSKSGGSR